MGRYRITTGRKYKYIKNLQKGRKQKLLMNYSPQHSHPPPSTSSSPLLPSGPLDMTTTPPLLIWPHMRLAWTQQHPLIPHTPIGPPRTTNTKANMARSSSLGGVQCLQVHPTLQPLQHIMLGLICYQFTPKKPPSIQSNRWTLISWRPILYPQQTLSSNITTQMGLLTPRKCPSLDSFIKNPTHQGPPHNMTRNFPCPSPHLWTLCTNIITTKKSGI